MRKKPSIALKLGTACLLLSGTLICVPDFASAEGGQKQKAIRLGVDPQKYLQNRHRRVQQARQQANIRAATKHRAASPSQDLTNSPDVTDNLSLHPDLADRPGFNEFSHVKGADRQNAQEIMQFLKSFHPQSP